MNDSRLELDSHANMPVVGKYAYILLFTGQTADINTYNPRYEPIQIRIVDAAVQYTCPYSGMIYICIMKNRSSNTPLYHEGGGDGD